MEEFGSLFSQIPARYPELAGKVALVTGSTRGIGKGIAMRLAREGMKVAITGRSADDLNPEVAAFQTVGAEVTGIPADLGKPGDAERLFDEVMARYGRVDLLVNNAADLRRKNFFDVEQELFDYQLEVNIRGPWILAQRAAKAMREAKIEGSIIFTSSVGGLRAHFRSMPYDMTKGALDQMTRALAIEAAEHRIRVNAIAPGATWVEKRGQSEDTPQAQAVIGRIPLRRFGYPLEMGAAVAFLASPDAAYITGQIIYVDGGITAQLSPKGQDI